MKIFENGIPLWLLTVGYEVELFSRQTEVITVNWFLIVDIMLFTTIGGLR